MFLKLCGACWALCLPVAGFTSIVRWVADGAVETPKEPMVRKVGELEAPNQKSMGVSVGYDGKHVAGTKKLHGSVVRKVVEPGGGLNEQQVAGGDDSRALGILEENATMIRLAKRVRPSVTPSQGLQMPRVIWQSWKSDGQNDSMSLWVPKERAKLMLSWIRKNPAWEYRLFDDEDIKQYTLKNFGPDHLDILHTINQGANKVDFWRLLAMFHDGGAYFDTDTKAVVPLENWLDANTTYITGIGRRGDFHQWGIIAAKGHCIMQQAIEVVKANVRSRKTHTAFVGLTIVKSDSTHHGVFRHKEVIGGVEGLGGPPVLMKAANICFFDPTFRKTMLPGFRICNGNSFGHRCVFKGAGMESTWNWESSLFDDHRAANLLQQDLQECLPLTYEGSKEN